MRAPRSANSFLLGLAVALVACGKESTSVPPVAPIAPVVSVTVTLTKATMQVGSTQQLAASTFGSGGVTLTGRKVAWSSSAPSVVLVSDEGLATAVGPGNATVSAQSEGQIGTAAIAVPTPPTLRLTSNVNKQFVGDTAVLTWSSTNAATCTASGAWSDAKAIAGTLRAVPTSGGVLTYRLRCDGDGGSATDSLRLVVPMPVFATSYENATRISLANPTLPLSSDMGLPGWQTQQGLHGGSGAFADFFQDGSYSALVTLAPPPTTLNGVTIVEMGSLHFLKRAASGVWSDYTSSVLTDPTSCISPRKAVVADFNNDKRPDVFLSCHGPDEDNTKSLRPQGEYSRVLLSQPDGFYRNVELPYWAYAHGAAAGDLDNDGNVDLVVTNTISSYESLGRPTVTDYDPFVLRGDGAGGFSLDLGRLPRALFNRRGIYSLELVDLFGSGKLDLLYGGSPPDATGHAQSWIDNGALYPGFIRNDGAGRFLSAPTYFPNVRGASGIKFDLALDFVVRNGAVFVSQVEKNYRGIAVTRVELSTMQARMVYERVTPFNDGDPATYFTWMYPRDDGIMVARAVNCPIAGFASSRCGVSFPWR